MSEPVDKQISELPAANALGNNDMLPIQQGNSAKKIYLKQILDEISAYGMNVVKDLTSTSITLEAAAETRYIYGELSSLTVSSLPTEGFVNILFTSGTTPTVLTLPNTVKMPEWVTIGANMTVMIGIADGVYGSAQIWES